MQPRVVREVDHAHAAAAEDPVDAIGADLRAGFEQGRRLEEAVAGVVRLQQREHFVLDVDAVRRVAHQRHARLGLVRPARDRTTRRRAANARSLPSSKLPVTAFGSRASERSQFLLEDRRRARASSGA